MTVAEFKKFLEENNVPDDLEMVVWTYDYGWKNRPVATLDIYEYSDRKVIQING